MLGIFSFERCRGDIMDTRKEVEGKRWASIDPKRKHRGDQGIKVFNKVKGRSKVLLNTRFYNYIISLPSRSASLATLGKWIMKATER